MIYKLPYQKDLAVRAINVAKDGYICDIRKAKKPRSLNQNSYYWGVLIKQFSIDTGYTEQESHQLLGRQFLKYTKKDIEFTRSTTELSTIEFENYLEQCRMLASEQGIMIPLPNEVTEDYINQLEQWRF